MKGVAYLLSTYPSVSQTFVLREMLALEEKGLRLWVFALAPSRSAKRHPGYDALKAQVSVFPKVVGRWVLSYLLAHGKCLSTGLFRYLRVLGQVIDDRASWAAFVRAGYLAARVRKAGIDHLHAHSAATEATVAMFASALTGLSYSFTAHSYDIFIRRHRLCDKVRCARFIAVISEFNREFLVALCGEQATDKIHVVRCGLDVGEFASIRADRKLRRLTSPPIVLTVARLVKKKGHCYLLSALCRLKERGHVVQWVIVGDGPLRDMLEHDASARKMEGQVIFKGERTSEEVKELLAAADVFVLPCVRTENGNMDGIPVSLMEAMAAGVPVISTTLSGIPELITDGVEGLLVQPGDVEALAERIEYLLSRPEVGRRLAEAASRKIAGQFGLEANVRKLEALFLTSEER